MPMKYHIEELTRKGKIQHGYKLSSADASVAAAEVRDRTQNAVTVNPEYVSAAELEPDESSEEVSALYVTAEDIYKFNHGGDANFHEQPFRVKSVYELCATTANNMLMSRRFEILELVGSSLKRSAE